MALCFFALLAVPALAQQCDYSELGTSLRRDDIVLSAELQAGAVKFDVEAKNKIALREKES